MFALRCRCFLCRLRGDDYIYGEVISSLAARVENSFPYLLQEEGSYQESNGSERDRHET